MGQFVGYIKQYIFYRVFWGMFCRDINLGICLFISISVIKHTVIFVTICLIDKMYFVIKRNVYPNGKIIICSNEFNKPLYFVFCIFIKSFWKYTSDTGLFCGVNIFIFELVLYPKYQFIHLSKQYCFILFCRQLRLCITKAQGLAHTHKDAQALFIYQNRVCSQLWPSPFSA